MLPKLRRNFTRRSPRRTVRTDPQGSGQNKIWQTCLYTKYRDAAIRDVVEKKFFVFIRESARVPVTIRLPEP